MGQDLLLDRQRFVLPLGARTEAAAFGQEGLVHALRTELPQQLSSMAARFPSVRKVLLLQRLPVWSA
ncbi:Cytidylate kinase (fragment) [Nitrospira lenta]|uniref:Cytidylate kinase n=1 Tax=Nitrospira lenta TaxID=1436998 RepID=A0A330L8T5_9BACT